MGALLPLLLLPVLMYLLLIRPQQKKVRAQQALLSHIQEGDEVMLSSGIFGFVTAIEGDTVWVEVAEGVDLRVIRAAIARKVDPTPTATDNGAAAAEDDTTDTGTDADTPHPVAGDAES